MERMELLQKKKIALSMSSDALLCRCVDLSILHLSVSINLRCNLVPLWLLHPTPSFCGAASGGTRLIPVVRSQRGRRRGHPSLFALLILLPARAHDASSKTLCRLTHVGQLVPLARVRMLRQRDGCGKKTGWRNRGLIRFSASLTCLVVLFLFSITKRKCIQLEPLYHVSVMQESSRDVGNL